MSIGFNLNIKCEQQEESEISKENDRITVSHKSQLNSFEYTIKQIGISGLLALTLILTICSIAIIQTLKGMSIEIPDTLSGMATLVIGYFFGHKKSSTNEQDQNSEKPIGFTH